MKICRVNQMREMDQRAISEYGIPQEILMENAGAATYYAIKQVYGAGKKSVSVFCGIGNNGGDGLVVARKLHSLGWNCEVIIVGDASKFKGSAGINFEIITRLGIKIIAREQEQAIYESIATADLIIDALLGTGLDREVSGNFLDFIILINNSDKPVVSIDIPSGIHGDNGQVMGGAVQADITVTYGLPKLGNLLFPGYAFCGKLYVTHISFPPEMHSNDQLKICTNDPLPVPERKPDAHKGSCGKALFIAGSASYIGAPGFAAQSFLKAGGGLSYLATPHEIAPFIAGGRPEIVLAPQESTKAGSLSPDSRSAILELAGECDFLVIGPGISLVPETQELVTDIVSQTDKPLLIDGDGLTAISGNPASLKSRSAPTVLTPHPGEMARLINQSVSDLEKNRVDIVQKFAKQWEAVIVLKGAHSLIGYPDGNIYLNLTGNPGMATAGSGDVLAGTIPAMFGLGYGFDTAVRMGVFLHGFAGDLCAQDTGEDGVIASDILDYLPEALYRMRNDFLTIENRYTDKISIL